MSDKPPGIVVGIDGSANGQAAADWALREAKHRGCALTLVYAWQYGVTVPFVPVVGPDPMYVQADAQHMVESAAAHLRTEATTDVDIRAHAIEAPPGEALVDEASKAELLVVGSRGQGMLPRIGLGSVSNYCVHYAGCPTVVVPSPSHATTGRHRAPATGSRR